MANINLPTVGFAVPSAMRTLPLSLEVLMGFLIHQMRLHFSTAGTISRPALQAALWTPADQTFTREAPTSKMRICQFTDEEDIKAGTLPAIMLKRSEFKVENLAATGKCAISEANALRGEIVIPKAYSGTFTYVALSREQKVAGTYADEIEELLSALAPTNLQCTTLQKFNVDAIGAPERLAKGTDIWTCGVSVSLAFNKETTLTPQAPRLSQVISSSDMA